MASAVAVPGTRVTSAGEIPGIPGRNSSTGYAAYADIRFMFCLLLFSLYTWPTPTITLLLLQIMGIGMCNDDRLIYTTVSSA